MSWYALYTRPRHEKKVYDDLLEKKMESFLPLVKTLSQWKDRRKWVEKPLFNSYVFINIELQHKLIALQTKGVVRLVSFGGKPAMIPDWQIQQLKTVLDNKDNLEPEKYLKRGDYVEIIEGPMKGVKGYLREQRGVSKLAILIDGIYQSASFVVDTNFVRKIEEKEPITRP